MAFALGGGGRKSVPAAEAEATISLNAELRRVGGDGLRLGSAHISLSGPRGFVRAGRDPGRPSAGRGRLPSPCVSPAARGAPGGQPGGRCPQRVGLGAPSVWGRQAGLQVWESGVPAPRRSFARLLAWGSHRASLAFLK